MLTGVPVTSVSPVDTLLWARFLDRRPPGDVILRELLARIGMRLDQIAESWFGRGEKREMTAEDWDRYYEWHFWEKREDSPEKLAEEQEIRDAWGSAYEAVSKVDASE